MFIEKPKLCKILGLNLILMVVLYGIAIILTLTGHDYFITQYHNDTLQLIQDKLTEWHLIYFINGLFATIESAIIQFYILKRKPNIFVLLGIFISFSLLMTFHLLPNWAYTLIITCLYLLIPLLYKEYRSKNYLKILIRLVIIMIITFVLQYAIKVIKTNSIYLIQEVCPLSILFILNVEYYLALSLVVAWLMLMQEGVLKLWTAGAHGGSSQTSRTKLWKSNQKTTTNLTNKQKRKLRLLYARLFITQSLGFLFVMLFPILIGKWLEFMIVYLSFALTRYVLGFKKSLHFKREIICISVAAVLFWFITLITPSFNIILIIAILYGIGLATLLHFTYRYKRLYLFKSVANKDRYAEFYMALNADMSEHKVRITCNHFNISKDDTEMLVLYLCNKEKISYIAYKFKITEMTVNRHLDDILEIIVKGK